MTAAADIVIRRCSVRVVRHGGWSWGPQPRRLVDQVLAALPGLITERLGELVPDGAQDMEITEPVRVTVSLTLADLLAGRFDPHLHAAVTVRSLPEPPLVSGPSPHQAVVRPYLTPPPDLGPAHRTMTLAEFLGDLARRGELFAVLALLPLTTLEAWYQALAPSAAETPGPATAGGPSPAGLSARHGIRGRAPRVAAPPPGPVAVTAASRARQLRADIAAIVARAGQQDASGSPRPGAAPGTGPAAGHAPTGTRSTHSSAAGPAAGQLLGVPSPRGFIPAARSSSADPVSATTMSQGGPGLVTNPATVVPTGPSQREITPPAGGATRAGSGPGAGAVIDIASALPFLLLGPLAQAGYLAALAPALQPVGLEAQTAAFAAALAYTVLGPLDRGWRRRPEDQAAATAFAGLGAPVPGPELTEFARIAAPVLPGIDAVITRALADGHTAGEPLVLAGGGDGLLLIDREGLFPVAWADTVAGLRQAWRMCGSPPVLVAPAAAGALTELAEAGASFVAAAPPARGERWRRLPHGLWTNDRENPALDGYAGGYRRAVDLAAELIWALAEERAAVPLADGPALGRSLLLAAGLGLGTLAWALWREREPTDPLLALERFADLSARVSFEPERVRVRLPLGPRHSDLYAHGLLADVYGVPWFGGRVVEFSGG